MSEGYYRTGQAAKQLAISSYHVRRLCEVGEIAAELTGGRQWRIPVGEVARLGREGVPPIPTELPEEADQDSDMAVYKADRSADEVVPEGLYAGPSPAVIEAAEQVKIVENRVRQRRLEREVEEVEDWFRERTQKRNQEIQAKCQRDAAEHAERRREVWSDSWMKHALGTVPSTAPREVELAVHFEVRAVLQQLNGTGSDAITRRLVDAATEKALAPWRHTENVRRAMESTVNTMPFAMRHDEEFSGLRRRACEAAAAAVVRMTGQPSQWEMTTAATQAMKPIVQEYEHKQTCARTVALLHVPGANSEEERATKEAVRLALSALPVGTTQKGIEQTCESTLAPFRTRIAHRKEVARHQAEQQSKRRTAEWKVAYQLSHIDSHLREEYEFDGGYAERSREATRLRGIIEPQLVEDLLEDPHMSTEAIRERIEELVEEYL